MASVHPFAGQPFRVTILALLLFVATAVSSSPTSSNSTNDLYTSTSPSSFPSPSPSASPSLPFNLEEGIKCYAVPYGGIGFLSHLLTYWTLLCLYLGRSPCCPWKDFQSWKVDLVLGCLSLLSAVILTIVTMVRCASAWPLILIAIWKMLLSITLGATSLHVANSVRKFDFARGHSIHSWLIIYAVGVIVGLTGLAELLRSTWDGFSNPILVIIQVFGGLVSLVVIGAFLGARRAGQGMLLGLLTLFVAINVLAALFSDWVLAAILVTLRQGNWVGAPGGDNQVIYWAYFIAKRLPLFSM